MSKILNSYTKFLQKGGFNKISSDFLNVLEKSLNSAFDPDINGNLKKWLPIYNNIPVIKPGYIQLDCDAPVFGLSSETDDALRPRLFNALQELHPWRKGPFSLFGIDIDAEWRSDLKWNRVMKSGVSLKNKNILDIGSGNGYYIFRMLGEGAASVTGVDPGVLSVIQFKIFQTYFDACGSRETEYGYADVFPVPFEVIPENSAHFDIIFSMGVLYHRKQPEEHLKQIFSLLAPGGTIFLETLIVESDEVYILQPPGRYAQMRNVYKIPHVSILLDWLELTGFCNMNVVDISRTTFTEQRSTDWMTFHSLENFLDPEDISLTAEGHPAPVRALITAQKS